MAWKLGSEEVEAAEAPRGTGERGGGDVALVWRCWGEVGALEGCSTPPPLPPVLPRPPTRPVLPPSHWSSIPRRGGKSGPMKREFSLSRRLPKDERRGSVSLGISL